MSRWSEREIARKLAERDELEPPPGLLEKIKSEIPPMIPAGTGVPEIDRRPSMPPRQRWLIAASLVAMIGAGVFAIHHQMEVASMEAPRYYGSALGAEKPAVSPPPPPARPRPSPTQPVTVPERAPQPKQLSREEAKKLSALGYAGSPAGVDDGVVAGEAGPAPVAPPVAAPSPPASAVQEAPLLDERRAEEKERINVGGNESGQQGFDNFGEGPGAANGPQPAPPAPRALAKAAGAEPSWQVPSPRILEVKTDVGTASHDLARRSIAEGKLPDPAAIRVGEILSAFDAGDAPPVEGGATPFVHGPRYRLLRIHPGGARPIRVSFNPSIVARYRLIGSGASVLYEIELRPDASHQAPVVGTLDLGSQGKAVLLSDLDSTWDKASPGFRLAALAAEFAEILKRSPVDSSALHRLSAEIGRLPKGPKADELGNLVEKAAKIRG
jgi:hypothetical protein